jgi:hypothetical protein
VADGTCAGAQPLSDEARCPFRVKSGNIPACAACPFCLQEQTSSASLGITILGLRDYGDSALIPVIAGGDADLTDAEFGAGKFVAGAGFAEGVLGILAAVAIVWTVIFGATSPIDSLFMFCSYAARPHRRAAWTTVSTKFASKSEH